MPTDKNKVIKQLGVSDQQSLVKRLTETKKTKIFVIPAGKTITEQLDREGLKHAAYNWLRGCAEFTSVKVSLAKSTDGYKVKKTKVTTFPPQERPNLPWETHPERRKWLAEQIGEALFRGPLAVIADLEGLWILEDVDKKFSPASEDWEPFVEFELKQKA